MDIQKIKLLRRQQNFQSEIENLNHRRYSPQQNRWISCLLSAVQPGRHCGVAICKNWFAAIYQINCRNIYVSGRNLIHFVHTLRRNWIAVRF